MYILECQLPFDLTSSRKDCHDFFPVPTWSKIFIFDFAASENNWKAGSGACFGRLILQYQNLDENGPGFLCCTSYTAAKKRHLKNLEICLCIGLPSFRSRTLIVAIFFGDSHQIEWIVS